MTFCQFEFIGAFTFIRINVRFSRVEVWCLVKVWSNCFGVTRSQHILQSDLALIEGLRHVSRRTLISFIFCRGPRHHVGLAKTLDLLHDAFWGMHYRFAGFMCGALRADHIRRRLIHAAAVHCVGKMTHVSAVFVLRQFCFQIWMRYMFLFHRFALI